jgi:hypothetical protein
VDLSSAVDVSWVMTGTTIPHVKCLHIGKSRTRILEEYPDLDINIEPYVRSPEEEERIRAKLKAAFEQHPPQTFRDRSNGE